MLNAHFMGLGGSQYVTLETAIAFAERGYEVYIDSPFIGSKSDLDKIAEFFGSKINGDIVIGFGDPGESRIVINTSGDVLSGPGDAIYLHYPFFMDYRVYYSAMYGVLDMIGKCYSMINSLALPILMKKIKVYIANSTYTARFFSKLGIKPIVVHPPVNVDEIRNRGVVPLEERERYVLIVSRFSPEKRVDLGIHVAKQLRNTGLRVVVAGALPKYNKGYLNALIEKAEKEQVDDIIEFYTDTPRDKLLDLYRYAFVYLHTTPKEHFGISIVEAMAAGTPTIIPMDSGSWIDIAHGDHSITLPYRNTCEIRGIILELTRKPHKWKAISANGLRRSSVFDRRIFRRKIFDTVVRYVLGNR